MMPTKEAAAICGMPISISCGIRCVPISPLAVPPHTKKAAAQQPKSRVVTTSRAVMVAFLADIPRSDAAPPIAVGFRCRHRRAPNRLPHGSSRMKRKDQRQQNHRDDNQRHGADAPAGVSDHPHEERQKNHLPGGAGAAENAQSQTAPGDKPAIAHRRGQDRSDTAGAKADDDSPDQKKLPELSHDHRAANAGDQEQTGCPA